MLQFAGTPMHRLPVEYYARECCADLLKALARLARVDARAFTAPSCDDLSAELSLHGCVFDQVLQHFFEPALLVHTLSHAAHGGRLLFCAPVWTAQCWWCVTGARSPRWYGRRRK